MITILPELIGRKIDQWFDLVRPLVEFRFSGVRTLQPLWLDQGFGQVFTWTRSKRNVEYTHTYTFDKIDCFIVFASHQYQQIPRRWPLCNVVSIVLMLYLYYLLFVIQLYVKHSDNVRSMFAPSKDRALYNYVYVYLPYGLITNSYYYEFKWAIGCPESSPRYL